MKAIQVARTGGPEVLTLVDVPVPDPKPNEALVQINAAGVNFIDVYFREGRYPASLPFINGQEAAGVVVAVGADVTTLRLGDRVAYSGALGSYAEFAAVSADRLVRIPEELDFAQAAAAMLQGMTAHYLTHSTWPLKQHETCLVHAAAGGAGMLIVQMAKMRGAHVIGTTSTEAKAAKAREAGCDEVILYTEKPFDTEVKRLTNGRGVDVVYDSVGKATFEQSLNSLRPRGLMVTFGNASGPVPALEPLLLNAKGSLFLTRPTLAHHCATRDELLWRANDVLGWVASGALKLHIEKTYPMSQAAQAQIDLASRKTTGKLLLDPAK